MTTIPTDLIMLKADELRALVTETGDAATQHLAGHVSKVKKADLISVLEQARDAAPQKARNRRWSDAQAQEVVRRRAHTAFGSACRADGVRSCPLGPGSCPAGWRADHERHYGRFDAWQAGLRRGVATQGSKPA